MSDFCLAWDDLKPMVSDEALRRGGLPEETRKVIAFMRMVTEHHCKTEV